MYYVSKPDDPSLVIEDIDALCVRFAADNRRRWEHERAEEAVKTYMSVMEEDAETEIDLRKRIWDLAMELEQVDGRISRGFSDAKN